MIAEKNGVLSLDDVATIAGVDREGVEEFVTILEAFLVGSRLADGRFSVPSLRTEGSLSFAYIEAKSRTAATFGLLFALESGQRLPLSFHMGLAAQLQGRFGDSCQSYSNCVYIAEGPNEAIVRFRTRDVQLLCRATELRCEFFSHSQNFCAAFARAY